MRRSPSAAVTALPVLLVLTTLVLAVLPPTAASARAAVSAPAGKVAATGPGAARRPAALKPVLRRVLVLVNRVRATGAVCGARSYPAVPPLRVHRRLNRAAKAYARRMGRQAFFAHVAPDGSDPGDRIRAAGYRWTSYGENLAAGFTGAAVVVAAWLASPGHCANLMGEFTEIGLGHAFVPGSPYGHYWVQELATR